MMATLESRCCTQRIHPGGPPPGVAGLALCRGCGVRLLVLISADRVQGDWITAGPADRTAVRAE
jgi:hypothetical protein